MTQVNLASQLITEFQANEARINGQSKTAFHQKRKAALSRFEALGFPTTRHEEWKYFSTKKLVGQQYNFEATGGLLPADITALEMPDLAGNILYFVNGFYQEALSQIVSDEVVILPFALGAKQYPEVYEKHFAQYADSQTNAFVALNTAFAENGVFIHVPAGVQVSQPVILRFINDARQEAVAAQPRNLIIVEKNAEITVAEAYRTIGNEAAFTNTVTEAFVAEDARLNYYKVQNESDATHHIGSTQIHQSDNSHSYSVTVALNGGHVRNNLHIKLGQHVEAHLYGLYLPSGKQIVDNHTLVDHAKPNSFSNEFYKGIILDQATGVFNGKIFVQEDAQKTNAYQSCKNVLASPDATMNTKPQLEIFADDVKCSHGTTTGQLDENALFYLQSRGIPKDRAKTLLMLAFAEDVVEKIQVPALRGYLERVISEKIGDVLAEV